MPELPEVETTCSGIRPHLEDQTISQIEVRELRMRWPVPEEIDALRDAKVLSVTRRAKYILIEVATPDSRSGHIIIHLGMSGSLRITEPGTDLRKHDHVIFKLPNNREMRYHDPRRFGCVLWTEAPPAEHELIRHLGPEPLTDDFTVEGFIDSCSRSSSTIKQHIMNNKTVVGAGNIYACESLFLSGINPKRKANKVSKTRLKALHGNIRKVLTDAITQGGTTLRDFVNEEGKPGYFKQQLHVYDREGEECHNCDGTIKRIVLGQRSTFYCPKCQK